jgi:DNA-binding transcriptional regulator YiaG
MNATCVVLVDTARKNPKERTVTASSIRKIRAKIGVSQRKFAGLCGVSPRTVQGWEIGRPPSGPAIQLLKNISTLTRKTISCHKDSPRNR